MVYVGKGSSFSPGFHFSKVPWVAKVPTAQGNWRLEALYASLHHTFLTYEGLLQLVTLMMWTQVVVDVYWKLSPGSRGVGEYPLGSYAACWVGFPGAEGSLYYLFFKYFTFSFTLSFTLRHYGNLSKLCRLWYQKQFGIVIWFSDETWCFPHGVSQSCFFKILFFIKNFFPFIFISWRLIALQYCSGFCHTWTWISHGFTCVPHPNPPSHFPPHPILLVLPSAPALSTCLMYPTWAGNQRCFKERKKYHWGIRP